MTSDLVKWIKDGQSALSGGSMEDTFAIAMHEAVSLYARGIEEGNPSDEEMQRVKTALSEGHETYRKIGNLIDEHIGDDSLSEQTLGLVVTQLASAVRFHPSLIDNELYQRIITDAFGTVTDIADLSSKEFYLGGDPVDESANEAIRAYFNAVPFEPSFRDLKLAVTPVHMILEDWGAAVAYCRDQGVDPDAFLRDGTNLFRFSPDALPYVHKHRNQFEDLELRKVNNGGYVEGWLTGARIGVGEGTIPADSWRVLLTGYKPEDNAAIPGLNQRYNEPLLSTALNIHNGRL